MNSIEADTGSENAAGDTTEKKLNILSNVKVQGILEAADARIKNLEVKEAKVNQSIATETATNVVFFSLAFMLGFQGLYLAAIGTTAVYARLFHIKLKTRFTKSALQQAKKDFEISQNPREFINDRLTQRDVISNEIETDYNPFFAPARKDTNIEPSPYGKFCVRAGINTGAFVQTVTSPILPKNSACLAKVIEESVTSILTDPLPYYDNFRSWDKFKKSINQSHRWGLVGSIGSYSYRTFYSPFIPVDKTKTRTFHEMDDPCSPKGDRVLRSIFRTMNQVSLSQTPADKQDILTSTRAFEKARRSDYLEMLTNAIGAVGAAEFTMVVVQNAIANAGSIEKMGLALLWAATAWVSIDPLKHQLDDAKPISHRIENANEAIATHRDALKHLEDRDETTEHNSLG